MMYLVSLRNLVALVKAVVPTHFIGSPGASLVKNPPANAGDVRDLGSIPELGGSRRVGNGNT